MKSDRTKAAQVVLQNFTKLQNLDPSASSFLTKPGLDQAKAQTSGELRDAVGVVRDEFDTLETARWGGEKDGNLSWADLGAALGLDNGGAYKIYSGAEPSAEAVLKKFPELALVRGST